MATSAKRIERAVDNHDAGRIDLARLNGAEREVLRLLAEGHTAKSIASSVGCSTGAVNERLREARRKTGVGSSRELARLFRAAESRDENIGVASESESDAGIAPQATRTWSAVAQAKGWIIMIVASMIGLAALLAYSTPHQGPAPAAANGADPLLGSIIRQDHFNPRERYLALRSEGRDAAWAGATEEKLRSRYERIPYIGTTAAPLRVACGRTLCEVTGFIDAPQPTPQRPAKEMDLAMEGLQGKALNDDLGKVGLKSEGVLFTSPAESPDRSLFLAYWSRAAA